MKCLIRKVLVAATPEEFVRQRVLAAMEQLGYPMSLIAVEQSLHTLPYLKDKNVPLRRADILCFGKSNASLYPLLLVECKATKINSKVLRQVCGYNAYVKAHFIAVANQEEMRVGWLDSKSKEFQFVSGLPRCKMLESMVSTDNS